MTVDGSNEAISSARAGKNQPICGELYVELGWASGGLRVDAGSISVNSRFAGVSTRLCRNACCRYGMGVQDSAYIFPVQQAVTLLLRPQLTLHDHRGSDADEEAA